MAAVRVGPIEIVIRLAFCANNRITARNEAALYVFNENTVRAGLRGDASFYLAKTVVG